MKQIFLFCLLSCSVMFATAQTTSQLSTTPDPSKPVMIVTAACGKCLFGMTANDCTLAVRIKGKTYFVEGTGIDDHGDAHAKKGLCNATSKAEVQGEIVGNRFRATYFKLLSAPAKTN